jgi:D-alanine-D-alanine ligase
MSSLAMDRTVKSHRPLSIVVLLGGWSAEREISLAGGRNVIRALRSRGHDVRELDPAEIDFLSYPWAGVDAAFIALHGSFGEDGTVQTLLDSLGVPFTGSGSEASRLAMNKTAAKQRFESHGLPTPDYRAVHVQDGIDSGSAAAGAVGYPLVVKPNTQGSSIGVTIVERPDCLAAALELAFRYDPIALVERFVPGRELTVAVLERRALPALEIQPARSFFDFEAKYADAATQYSFESDLPQAVFEQVELLAVRAVDVLGCTGVARVDLRLDYDQRPWLLEVNTIPGLTEHSLVPKAAGRAGISIGELCEQLVLAKLQNGAESRQQRAA